MIRILCFGDSNTWGFIPCYDHQRFDNRWTRLLQKYLGEKYEIIEEGLNGRTLFSEDIRPGKEGKSGYKYLIPCLKTHDKFDIIILMLGTNELKVMYNNSIQKIMQMFEKFIIYITNYKSQIDGQTSKLIVSGIPPINQGVINSDSDDMYYGTAEKCRQLQTQYKNYCQKNNICYIDNSDLEVGVDGLHLTENSHKILAKRLYLKINEIKN